MMPSRSRLAAPREPVTDVSHHDARDQEYNPRLGRSRVRRFMHRVRLFAVALTLIAVANPAKPEVPPLPTVLQVLGNVTNAARPVGNALVIALNLNSFDAVQTFSANDGSFTLPNLPAAVYKIIAIKSGFVPAFAMILPTQKDQRIKLRLANQKVAANDKEPNQEIWALR